VTCESLDRIPVAADDEASGEKGDTNPGAAARFRKKGKYQICRAVEESWSVETLLGGVKVFAWKAETLLLFLKKQAISTSDKSSALALGKADVSGCWLNSLPFCRNENKPTL
jgi:hypothetical protein